VRQIGIDESDPDEESAGKKEENKFKKKEGERTAPSV